MRRKKAKKETSKRSMASVKKEMAKPRMSRSAKIAELKLDTARTPEQPSLQVQANRRRHRLLLLGLANGIKISALKIL